jgi:RNA polymerase sigma-70 factor, ECF subfamily
VRGVMADGGASRVAVDQVGELEILFRERAPGLWRALYGYAGGRRQIAEDALAEAFALALEHRATIRTPLAWIYRTAFRLATRELRAERRQPPPLPDPIPGVDPAEVADLLAALSQLADRQRAAVILHDQEGFTAPEIGAMLGLAAPTVRVHLLRGRRHLRTALRDEEER